MTTENDSAERTTTTLTDERMNPWVLRQRLGYLCPEVRHYPSGLNDVELLYLMEIAAKAYRGLLRRTADALFPDLPWVGSTREVPVDRVPDILAALLVRGFLRLNAPTAIADLFRRGDLTIDDVRRDA